MTTKTATVWTCRVQPVEGQAQRLGILFLNGGTEQDVHEVARRQFGDCTVDQVQDWPDGTTLKEAVNQAALPVTPHGVQASALGS
jgi:hypothetical protein